MSKFFTDTLEQWHKILMHIFPFQNILHLFLSLRKKDLFWLRPPFTDRSETNRYFLRLPLENPPCRKRQNYAYLSDLLLVQCLGYSSQIIPLTLIVLRFAKICSIFTHFPLEDILAADVKVCTQRQLLHYRLSRLFLCFTTSTRLNVNSYFLLDFRSRPFSPRHNLLNPHAVRQLPAFPQESKRGG